MNSVNLRVVDKQTKSPVEEVAVAAAYSNGTVLSGRTDKSGEYKFEMYRTDDKMRFAVAAKEYKPLTFMQVPKEVENVIEVEWSQARKICGLFCSSTIRGICRAFKDASIHFG